MNRRTLDLLFSAGGVVLGVMLLILGLVLNNQSSFAKNYVRDQLSEQQITFTPAANLVKGDVWRADVLETFGGNKDAADKFIADNKLTAEADSACLNKYAGKLMTTGKMAECYANSYIRLHMKDGSVYDAKFSANAANHGPKSYTYATIGGIQRELRAQVATATEKSDPKLPEYQTELDKVNGIRSTLQTGETLRGLLLTSYGFSVFGDRASLAAIVCFAAFALMVLLSIAGFIHAASVKRHAVKVVEAPAGVATA